MRQEIGENIAEVRKAQGKTQEDVANVLGFKRQTISKWEKGANGITIANIMALAEHFGVSCDKLLRGVEADNLEVHSQLGLEDRAIANLKSIIEVEVQSKLGLENIRSVLNDVISSEAFKHLILASTTYRLLCRRYEAELSTQEQKKFDLSDATQDAIKQALRLTLEKVENATDEDRRVQGENYFLSSFLLMNMLENQTQCQDALDELEREALKW